jgi:RNA polymerase sigma-70 factor (ECF subfamily)
VAHAVGKPDSDFGGPVQASVPVALDLEPSFERLYREHFAFVWRTLRRFGVQPAQLDDATQEVFIVVHRRLAELRPGSSPRAWLFAIAQRVASDQRRTVRRKGGLLPLDEGLAAASGAGPDAGAQRSEASDIVLRFLDTLDDDRRAVFVLVELEQMSAPEVSQALNANTSTVYSRLASARKALVEYVQHQHPDAMEVGRG